MTHPKGSRTPSAELRLQAAPQAGELGGPRAERQEWMWRSPSVLIVRLTQLCPRALRRGHSLVAWLSGDQSPGHPGHGLPGNPPGDPSRWMSWEFGAVCAGVSVLSAATSWGSRGSHLRLRPQLLGEAPVAGAAGRAGGCCGEQLWRLQRAGAGGRRGGSAWPWGEQGPSPAATLREPYHVQRCEVEVALPLSHAVCLTPEGRG